MRHLSDSDLKIMLEVDTPPCVSIYVPLRHAGDENCAGGFRNLLATARELLNRSYSSSQADRVLEALEYIKPRQLAGCEEGTLAIFRSPTFSGYKVIPAELPGLAVVSESFHIRPLLADHLSQEIFHVLHLEKGRASLYRGSERSLERIRVFEDAAASNAETRSFGLAEPRSGTFRQILERLGLPSLAHGTAFDRQSEFLRHVESEVRELLGARRSPLILAGENRYRRIYRQLNRYGRLLRVAMTPLEMAFAEDARRRAHRIATPSFRADRRRLASTLRYAERSGRLLTDLEGIIGALARDEVRTIVVNGQDPQWGRVDWATGRVRLHACQLDGRDDDLVDDCLELALARGCHIVHVDWGLWAGHASLSAVLRETSPLPQASRQAPLPASMLAHAS